MSSSLWPRGLQHARLPCPSLSPRVDSDSRPLNRWCHPTISSSAIPSCPQSFPILTRHTRWPKYWSFSISPSNEYSGLISFRVDWLDLLTVEVTLKSLFQHQSLKASILQCSASFMVHFSHPYMITGKTIALPIWTFICQVLSLIFNTLYRFVIAFLPRSKCILI